MHIQTNVYADFLTLVAGLRGQGAMFWWENVGQTQFKAFAITNNGTTVVQFPGDTQAKPGSFDTDFPEAIQLQNVPNFPANF
jgi:hypothetical protein